MRFLLYGIAAVAVPAVVVLSAGLAAEKVKKVPTIAEIMNEAHACRTAYIKVIRAELWKDETDWAYVEFKSRELIRVGKLLAKNTPPRGAKASWKKLTDLYVAHATILSDAAEHKDMETALRHQKALQGMCATCHRAHR